MPTLAYSRVAPVSESASTRQPFSLASRPSCPARKPFPLRHLLGPSSGYSTWKDSSTCSQPRFISSARSGVTWQFRKYSVPIKYEAQPGLNANAFAGDE